jgi:hypothetical protein
MCQFLRARTSWSVASVGLLSLLVISAAGIANAGQRGPRLKAGEYNPAHDSVEMFAAAEAGQIKVRFIPRDDTQGRILIENLTDKPLNVQLPAAFAAVPALAQLPPLAQFQPFGQGNGRGQQGGQQGGQNQSVGGGGQQGGGQGMGQNFFNVPAEKVANVKVPCVCLEHGKDNPRPAIPYQIVHIAQFTGDVNVHALCTLLGQGEIDQRAAQVAAWHLANGMSWKELAAKRIERLDGSSTPYFTADEIRRAKLAVKSAEALAKAPAPSATPGLADTARTAR